MTHVSVIQEWQNIEDTFDIDVCSGCEAGCTGSWNSHHCPICPVSKFKPTRKRRVFEHLHSHFFGPQGNVLLKGYRITGCFQDCHDTTAQKIRSHFHCPFCIKTIIKKSVFIKHAEECDGQHVSTAPQLASENSHNLEEDLAESYIPLFTEHQLQTDAMDNGLSRILVSIDPTYMDSENEGLVEKENKDYHSSESDSSDGDSRPVSPPHYDTLESLKKKASGRDVLGKNRKSLICHKIMTSKREPNSFMKLVKLPLLPYKCFSCSLTTSDLETLAEHCEVVHKEDLLIPCEFCVNYRAPLIKLVQHQAQVHNKLEYLAFRESKSAITETAIAAQYIHEGKYSCLKCEFSDTNFLMLKSHAKEVHNDSVYQCLQCNFKAANMPSLKNHISVNHIEAEPFKCITCNFKSSFSSTVVRHIKRHKGVVGIKSCNMCSFKTELVSDLRMHVRKHLLEEIFECFLCHETFNRMVDASGHYETLHSMKVSTELKCAQCPLTFHLHKDLTDHESEKHSQNKPYGCKLCEYSFSTVRQFTQHLCADKRTDFENMVIFHKSSGIAFKDTFKKFVNSEPSNGTKYFKKIVSESAKSDGEYKCHSCSFKTDTTTDLVDHIKMTHISGNEDVKSKTISVNQKRKNNRRLSGNHNHSIEEDSNDSDICMDEVPEDMDEFSSNIDRMNCTSKSVNSTGEMTPTNVRKSSRNRVTPIKYKEASTCEICNFVATSPELLSKHIDIFHRRKLQNLSSPNKEGNIVSEKFIKVRLERSKLVENLTTPEKSTQNNTSSEMRKRKELSTIKSECNSSNACDVNWAPQKTKIRKTDDDDFDNHPNSKRKSNSKVSKSHGYFKKIMKESDEEMDSADQEMDSADQEMDSADQSMDSADQSMDPTNQSAPYRKCHLCDYQSERADTLLTHVTHNHLEAVGKKTCYHCQLQFDDVDRLKFHAAVAHDQDDPFHCGICGLCIPTSHLLEAHLYYKHRRKMTLQCIHCLRTFGSLKLMKYHMKDHMDAPEKVSAGLYLCAYCSFSTSKGKQFRKHLEVNHPKFEKFQCKYCSHISPSIAHYQKHMFELHHKIREFNCTYCDYCTGRKDLLKNHVRRMHKTD